MDTSYHPPKINRYWKRPKLRVYDCNVRDAERFYQESYKQYLSDKEDSARRAARARSIDTQKTTDFYPHLLAGSFKREAREEVSRQAPELPPLPTPLAEAAKGRWDPKFSASETSFTTQQESAANFDPRDAASIEERYQKLKKLREELNLPAEAETGAKLTGLAALRSESVGAGAGGGYGADMESSFRSEKSSRTLASAGGPENTASYSFRSERTARMNGNAEGPEKYTTKSDTSTSEYKRRSDRGDEQNGTDYVSRFRSERSERGDASSSDYKSRYDRGGDQNSYDYKLKSDRGSEQTSSDYKSRYQRGGEQNSYDYKLKSERGGDANAGEYKFKSERAKELNLGDFKSKYELKTDDYKPSARSVDFDLPKPERKMDDFSLSSATERKTDRYSSLSSAGASSLAEKKSVASASSLKDTDQEADDDVSDMMKKLPSSQEILERISKMELDD